MKKMLVAILGLIFLAVSCTKDNKNEQKVNIHMWGGSQNINKFMDEKIAIELEKQEGIKLNRVGVVDIKDTVNKLIVEKSAGRKTGSIDILWVNGENFKILKEADVLLGGLNEKIPNAVLLKEATLDKDFGEEINGLEIPWGEAQFNFIYDTKKNTTPFTDYQTLKEFVQKNSGRFTYPAVTDFTGSAFVRNLAIDMIGLEKIESLTAEELKSELAVLWKYLKEIEKDLWRGGQTYPESESMVDILYSKGEIDVAMGYTINKVTSKIENKEFSETSKSFLFERGTLFNNHYLAIPKNSPNPDGALKVINYLISTQGQLLKQDPKNWGDFTVLDYSKIDQESVEKFKALLESDRLPGMDELKRKRVRELSPEKARIINEGWIENIGKK